MTENLRRLGGEQRLLPETIPSLLLAIANADIKNVHSKNQLKHWMSRNNAFEVFEAAITTFGKRKGLVETFDMDAEAFGEHNVLYDELELGEDSKETRFFQATLINPPPADKEPAIHIHARDGGIPTYGIFLPFTGRGILDFSRPISGSHFAADGMHAFKPIGPPRGDGEPFPSMNEERSEADVASVIAHAAQMAAAQLAFYLEKDKVAEPEVHQPIKRSRLAITLGRLASPFRRSL